MCLSTFLERYECILQLSFDLKHIDLKQYRVVISSIQTREFMASCLIRYL